MDTFQYRISLDADNRLVRTECDGLLGLSTAQRMVKDARTLGVQQNFSLLYDFRKLRIPATVPLAIVATFPLLAGLPHGAESLRSAAIIAIDQAGHEVWESYRMASRRSGMHWNYFLSEAEAMLWLRDRNHWDIRRAPPELKLR